MGEEYDKEREEMTIGEFYHRCCEYFDRINREIDKMIDRNNRNFCERTCNFREMAYELKEISQEIRERNKRKYEMERIPMDLSANGDK